MRDTGEFTGSFADQIALLYVYMPIIRQEIYEYVRLWNTHTIRYQKNRPYLPTGQPVVLYFNPPDGVRNYGSQPNRRVLEELQADLLGYGIIKNIF